MDQTEGGLNLIDARTMYLLQVLENLMDKKIAMDRLDDHWANIIDEKLKLRKRTRAQILTREPEALTCIIRSHFPCI